VQTTPAPAANNPAPVATTPAPVTTTLNPVGATPAPVGTTPAPVGGAAPSSPQPQATSPPRMSVEPVTLAQVLAAVHAGASHTRAQRPCCRPLLTRIVGDICRGHRQWVPALHRRRRLQSLLPCPRRRPRPRPRCRAPLPLPCLECRVRLPLPRQRRRPPHPSLLRTLSPALSPASSLRRPVNSQARRVLACPAVRAIRSVYA